jgi:hypothetical protein
VLDRATQAVLEWCLEIRERIGVLDILAGSTSLISTVTSQIKLRMISLVGLILVAIWTFSPVSGEASLRLMTEGEKSRPLSASINDMSPSGNLKGYTHFDREQYLTIVDSLFMTTLIVSTAGKYSALDPWITSKFT